MDTEQLRAFAREYTAAWCSQNAARVAAFFGENALWLARTNISLLETLDSGRS